MKIISTIPRFQVRLTEDLRMRSTSMCKIEDVEMLEATISHYKNHIAELGKKVEELKKSKANLIKLIEDIKLYLDYPLDPETEFEKGSYSALRPINQLIEDKFKEASK